MKNDCVGVAALPDFLLGRITSNQGGSAPKVDEGLRYNDGKPRFDLLPPEAMTALAAHYALGAKKYADRNWEKGMAWGKCFASMQRHAWAWAEGEDHDPETGSPHMIAVAWNAIALFIYALRGIGTDDRTKTIKEK